MVVQYYADSLGLPRPGIVGLNQRYIRLFEEWLRQKEGPGVFVIDRARGGATIDQLFGTYKEDEGYIAGEKDILVIHEGVCDCAPRPVSKSARRFISRLPGFIKSRIIAYLHNNRARLLKRGSVHFMVDKVTYRRILKEWLSLAVKSFKVIYIINIADTNDTIELHSPGFRESIVSYNEIIRQVVEELNEPRIRVIDMYTILKDSGLPYDELIVREDGHHITPGAHQLIYKEIVRLESGRNNLANV
jgi:acyl-CoA thioesterase-1